MLGKSSEELFGVHFVGRPYRLNGIKTCLDATLNTLNSGQQG